MGTKFCPNCGSEDVDLEIGGISGIMVCNDCGFKGNMPEKTLLGEASEMDDIEEDIAREKIAKKERKPKKTVVKKKGRKNKK